VAQRTWPTGTRFPYRLEEVSSHVGKFLRARDYEQPLERMWTCNYKEQKNHSRSHKEITSAKAE
uniref:Uncharacterized protein n=1 Tax=Saimiri boliviensis boliviensis TaxID=39432 RepID=A0A2K6SLK1_SAIBB